jgi:LPXTG-motif cell wall-anchored protein
MKKRRSLAVVLMAVALILVTIGAVNAALVTTGVLRSWDDGTNKYENGNLTMKLDNQLQPFYAPMAFDNKTHADACGVGTSSVWAGDAEIGLYHTDNAPAGAPGFQKSQEWSVVKCSTFNTNKYPAAADILTNCTVGNPGDPTDGGCVLIGSSDVVTPCSTGNCGNEIVTKFHVNTDLDCDGTQDTQFATAGQLCMYWGAVKPPATQPVWGGNIQARYGTGQGGDKTLNFNQLLGPNAVSMSSFGAVAEANSASLAMWAGAMLLGAAALWLWRKRSAV